MTLKQHQKPLDSTPKKYPARPRFFYLFLGLLASPAAVWSSDLEEAGQEHFGTDTPFGKHHKKGGRQPNGVTSSEEQTDDELGQTDVASDDPAGEEAPPSKNSWFSFGRKPKSSEKKEKKKPKQKPNTGKKRLKTKAERDADKAKRDAAKAAGKEKKAMEAKQKAMEVEAQIEERLHRIMHELINTKQWVTLKIDEATKGMHAADKALGKSERQPEPDKVGELIGILLKQQFHPTLTARELMAHAKAHKLFGRLRGKANKREQLLGWLASAEVWLQNSYVDNVPNATPREKELYQQVVHAYRVLDKQIKTEAVLDADDMLRHLNTKTGPSAKEQVQRNFLLGKELYEEILKTPRAKEEGDYEVVIEVVKKMLLRKDGEGNTPQLEDILETMVTLAKTVDGLPAAPETQLFDISSLIQRTGITASQLAAAMRAQATLTMNSRAATAAQKEVSNWLLQGRNALALAEALEAQAPTVQGPRTRFIPQFEKKLVALRFPFPAEKKVEEDAREEKYGDEEPTTEDEQEVKESKKWSWNPFASKSQLLGQGRELGQALLQLCIEAASNETRKQPTLESQWNTLKQDLRKARVALGKPIVLSKVGAVLELSDADLSPVFRKRLRTKRHQVKKSRKLIESKDEKEQKVGLLWTVLRLKNYQNFYKKYLQPSHDASLLKRVENQLRTMHTALLTDEELRSMITYQETPARYLSGKEVISDSEETTYSSGNTSAASVSPGEVQALKEENRVLTHKLVDQKPSRTQGVVKGAVIGYAVYRIGEFFQRIWKKKAGVGNQRPPKRPLTNKKPARFKKPEAPAQHDEDDV